MNKYPFLRESSKMRANKRFTFIEPYFVLDRKPQAALARDEIV
jgi:hypothetical protein